MRPSGLTRTLPARDGDGQLGFAAAVIAHQHGVAFVHGQHYFSPPCLISGPGIDGLMKRLRHIYGGLQVMNGGTVILVVHTDQIARLFGQPLRALPQRWAPGRLRAW